MSPPIFFSFRLPFEHFIAIDDMSKNEKKFISYETSNIFFLATEQSLDQYKEKHETNFQKPLSPKVENIACTLEDT